MSPKTRSLVATLLLVVAVLFLLRDHALIARTPVGIALQALAVVLMLWARLTFGMRSFHATANPTEGGLVTAGPYRFWRHPIYAAVLLFVWSGVLAHGVASTSMDLVLGAFATLMTAVRIQAEEQLLRASMPEYVAYAARTKRLIPFVF
ncbi:MAG TPA: isoprenylcysteine carboxylmethyltransferase family protein [Gemmatimonadaceae bacterium]|nr:isoprenylcysteine carboxylmethyltransferase family protein [Gemmatimonadaceae bacterium]